MHASDRTDQVRNVPDKVHAVLKPHAATARMSLSDYVKQDLEESAARPTLQEIDARVTARGSSGLHKENIVETLRGVR